jgi:hypothetical protein
MLSVQGQGKERRNKDTIRSVEVGQTSIGDEEELAGTFATEGAPK